MGYSKETEKNKIVTLIASLAVIVLLIPVTVALSYHLGDRHLYIASVLIAIWAMIPFFVSFEGRKPDARYLAVVAVLTAIAVASRAAFIWAPNFKPMAGIIIITAIACGPQTGFMCGALSMIISNIIFGQGPWTPWQMFCYGMIGFIAGWLGRGRILSEKHAIRSAIISFALVFVLSSAVLDTCSVFYMGGEISWAYAGTIYLAGIPVNITNALASAICVFLLVKPMCAGINRVKIKYGVKM